MYTRPYCARIRVFICSCIRVLIARVYASLLRAYTRLHLLMYTRPYCACIRVLIARVYASSFAHVYQGAVKHGRGNGYGAPDLCVMHGPPVYTCKFANIFANDSFANISNKTLFRFEHIEQNVGSLQTLFSMDYWDVSLKNNVKNVQKGITLQNRKVGKLFSLFTKPIDYIFWMCVYLTYITNISCN